MLHFLTIHPFNFKTMKCFQTLCRTDFYFSRIGYSRKRESWKSCRVTRVGTVRCIMQRKSIPHREITLPSKFSTLGLCLACNCIHDSILGIHADGGVILGVNYCSLAAQAFHLDGFVCRQGRVLQDIGVETLRELRAGLCKSEVRQGREGKKGERRDSSVREQAPREECACLFRASRHTSFWSEDQRQRK